MRKKIKIPRIIKIEKIEGLKIHCMFNNGETRLLDFNKILKQWNVCSDDIENKLFSENVFGKVRLRNYTLSWENLSVKLINEDGQEESHPYELSPDVLFKLSESLVKDKSEGFGNLIRKARLKAGLTQHQLATRSGTSRFYISRLENNRTDIELSTFRKIVEAGLDRHFKVVID